MIISYSGFEADFEHTALIDCYLSDEKEGKMVGVGLGFKLASKTACERRIVWARKSSPPEKKMVKMTSKLP